MEEPDVARLIVVLPLLLNRPIATLEPPLPYRLRAVSPLKLCRARLTESLLEFRFILVLPLLLRRATAKLEPWVLARRVSVEPLLLHRQTPSLEPGLSPPLLLLRPLLLLHRGIIFVRVSLENMTVVTVVIPKSPTQNFYWTDPKAERKPMPRYVNSYP